MTNEVPTHYPLARVHDALRYAVPAVDRVQLSLMASKIRPWTAGSGWKALHDSAMEFQAKNSDWMFYHLGHHKDWLTWEDDGVQHTQFIGRNSYSCVVSFSALRQLRKQLEDRGELRVDREQSAKSTNVIHPHLLSGFEWDRVGEATHDLVGVVAYAAAARWRERLIDLFGMHPGDISASLVHFEVAADIVAEDGEALLPATLPTLERNYLRARLQDPKPGGCPVRAATGAGHRMDLCVYPKLASTPEYPGILRWEHRFKKAHVKGWLGRQTIPVDYPEATKEAVSRLVAASRAQAEKAAEDMGARQRRLTKAERLGMMAATRNHEAMFNYLESLALAGSFKADSRRRFELKLANLGILRPLPIRPQRWKVSAELQDSVREFAGGDAVGVDAREDRQEPHYNGSENR